MRYEFRDTCYRDKIIRHIKALAFDSQGPFIAPTTQLHVIRRALERQQANLLVIVMTGQGRTLATRSTFMKAFELDHPRLADDCYTWQQASYQEYGR